MATDPAAPAPPPPVRDEEYPGTAVLGAALATFFFPVISLIAALILMSSQQGARKRAQLRTWAWVSAGWIALQVIFFVIVFASVASSGPDFDTGGPCQGGPEPGYAAEVQPDGSYVFPCIFGGTVTMRD